MNKTEIDQTNEIEEQIRSLIERLQKVDEGFKRNSNSLSTMIRKISESEEPLIYTYGGESHVDGCDFSEYGIQFNNLSISDIKPAEMAKLACEIVNHMIVNGHNFALVDSLKQDQRYELILLDNLEKK